jgi:hypothetical protein
MKWFVSLTRILWNWNEMASFHLQQYRRLLAIRATFSFRQAYPSRLPPSRYDNCFLPRKWWNLALLKIVEEAVDSVPLSSSPTMRHCLWIANKNVRSGFALCETYIARTRRLWSDWYLYGLWFLQQQDDMIASDDQFEPMEYTFTDTMGRWRRRQAGSAAAKRNSKGTTRKFWRHKGLLWLWILSRCSSLVQNISTVSLWWRCEARSRPRWSTVSRIRPYSRAFKISNEGSITMKCISFE